MRAPKPLIFQRRANNVRKIHAQGIQLDEVTAAIELHPLRRGLTVLVTPADLPALMQHEWTIVQANSRAPIYAVTIIRDDCGQRQVRMHRLLLGLEGGDERVGDHKNGDSLDNRRGNLRIATLNENSRNRRVIESLSGFKGVYLSSVNRFGAKLRGKRLGTFGTASEAAAAYDKAAREKYGEFAATNADLLGGSP